ncbi:hypothetical protein L1987_70865 [Smallanthus sonchifolius]|uniref:Uncharacterized protein n=1 Tax=Smallanthus sonchifolius TaxID=185202 RepID=A0ACB9ARP3_9ASTR|nr:hypothetical protein L1987_70865 [Smallanthus sonchifolius]
MAAEFALLSSGLDLKRRVFNVPILPLRVGVKNRLNCLVTKAVLQEQLKGLQKTKDLGFDVVKEIELRENGFMGMRKTKLVCTVGPACCSSEELEKLALGGMNVARLNMCHSTRDWHQDVIRKIKKLNQEKGFCVSVMIDTEGSQIHVLDHGVKEGDELVVDGGMATFEVIERIGNHLRCKCTDTGLLLPRAKFSFWRDGKLVEKHHDIPTFSDKDWSDIEFGISEGVDFIALSFVKDAAAVKHLKDHLSTKNEFVKVLAKIECLESLKNLEEIVETSDGIMVARGDLGVEVPLEQVPTVQEEIIDLCRRLNKPVVADVSEAVRQRADALMLSGESAMGLYGQKAISVLRMTSTRMELWGREENQQCFLPQIGESLLDQIAEQICSCAGQMANKLAVDAIFVYTVHGHMASLLSRNRPNPPIFAFTNKNSTRMALTLQWGVLPITFDLSDDMDANISKTTHLMKAKGVMKQGDVILVVSDVIPMSVTPSVYESLQVVVIE